MDNYNLAFDSAHIIILSILGQYLKLGDTLSLKDIIIRNYLARSANLLKSIRLIWENKCYSDAWILFRTLIDRLVYLRQLHDTDSWKEYDDWSFKIQYEYLNNIRSDQKRTDLKRRKEFEITKEQRQRYKSIVKKNVEWKKPHAEAVLKSMGLDFLYNYGYYFGSGFVHPLASDGLYDFTDLVGIKEENPYKNPKYLINNSILVGTLIIQESLNYSSFKWMAVLYNSLEEIRTYLSNFDPKAFKSLNELVKYVKNDPNYILCSS